MKAKLLFLALFVVFIVGCQQNINIPNENEPINVTIMDLILNPQTYLNKTIQVEATPKFIGANYFAQKGDFYLEDGNASIKVQPWAPTTVAQCRPNIECHPPAVMSDYLDKRVKIKGELKQFPKQEYINNQWQTTGTYYEVVTEKVEIV